MKRAFWSVSTVSGKCTSISPMGFPSLPNTSLVGRSELKGGLLGREGGTSRDRNPRKKELIPTLLRFLTKNSYTGLRTVIGLKLEGYSDFRHLLFGLSEESVKFLNQGLNSGEPMCFSGSRKKER